MYQPSYHWNCHHLQHPSDVFEPRRSTHRLLLYTILSRRGKPDLFPDLSQHCRPDKEVYHAGHHLRGLGCW